MLFEAPLPIRCLDYTRAMARIEIGNVANSMEFAMTESKIPESAKGAALRALATPRLPCLSISDRLIANCNGVKFAKRNLGEISKDLYTPGSLNKVGKAGSDPPEFAEILDDILLVV